MFALALKPLETAINRYLALDPDTFAKLAALENKIIHIEISDWNLGFYIEVKKTSLHLTSETPHPPNAIIRGRLFDLLRVAYQRGDSRSLFKNKIAISGQTEVGEKFRDLLQHIDIDWEEHLSRLTNDSIAHQLSFRFKQIMNFGKKTVIKLNENIKDYIHEEVPYFPTSDQCEDFYQRVGKLCNDVDRLEARVLRLQNKHRKHKD